MKKTITGVEYVINAYDNVITFIKDGDNIKMKVSIAGHMDSWIGRLTKENIRELVDVLTELDDRDWRVYNVKNENK